MLSANSTASGKQKLECGATKAAKISEAIITEKKKGKRREPNIQPLALQGTSGQQAESDRKVQQREGAKLLSGSRFLR